MSAAAAAAAVVGVDIVVVVAVVGDRMAWPVSTPEEGHCTRPTRGGSSLTPCLLTFVLLMPLLLVLLLPPLPA